MASERRFDEANRAAREHLERTKQRLAQGRARLQRLHESIDATNRHIESMSSWIEETERSLDEERRRRASGDRDCPRLLGEDGIVVEVVDLNRRRADRREAKHDARLAEV